MASRLLVEFAVAGVIPMLIISITEDAILSGESNDKGSLLMSAMLNACVFLCLILSGFAAKGLKARLNVIAKGPGSLARA